MPIDQLAAFLRAGKTALDIFKGIRDELPKSPKLDEQISCADQAFKATRAELAKDLDWRLCQCDFPGVPILWKKDMGKYGKHECPRCGDIYPRDHPVLDAPSSQFDSALLGARRGRRG